MRTTPNLPDPLPWQLKTKAEPSVWLGRLLDLERPSNAALLALFDD